LAILRSNFAKVRPDGASVDMGSGGGTQHAAAALKQLIN
jgi:hypothetical protein